MESFPSVKDKLASRTVSDEAALELILAMASNYKNGQMDRCEDFLNCVKKYRPKFLKRAAEELLSPRREHEPPTS